MKRVLISFLIMLIIFFLNTLSVKAHDVEIIDSTKVATGVVNPDKYRPNAINEEDIKPAVKIGNTIINTIGVIGAITSVLALILMGLRYMMGSVSEKAEYKKTMIPYLVGVLIFFAITQFLVIIFNLVNEVDKQQTIDSTVSAPSTVTDAAKDIMEGIQDMIDKNK